MQKHTLSLEVSGATAMWTRPDAGDVPSSYPAPTAQAVKSLFESILFLKSAYIVPFKTEICSPLSYHTYNTNYGGPLRKIAQIKNNNAFQLMASVLIDVCYRLHAEVVPSKAWLSGSNKKNTTNPAHAFAEMFKRRLKRGQTHSTPFLGWREFIPDYLGPLRSETEVFPEISTVLPSMLHLSFSEEGGDFKPVFRQNVKIEKGVLHYAE